MNEKLGIGLFVVFISVLSIGGALNARFLADYKPQRIAQHQPGREQTESGHSDSGHQTANPSTARAYEVTSTKTDQNNGCLADETPKECSLREIQDRSATFNGWLVGVGLLQLLGLVGGILVYRKQAKIMEGQLKVAEDTLVHANRAYVHVGLWESHPIKNEKGDIIVWRISARAENTGNTPTRNLQYSTTNVVTNCELPPGFRFESTREPSFTLIGPKQHFLVNHVGLRVESLLSAKRDEVWFYVYGWIEYDDVFGVRRHRTEFCYRIYPYGDPSRDGCDFGYLFHSDYNGADDECDHQRVTREKIPEPTPRDSAPIRLSADGLMPDIKAPDKGQPTG